MLPLDMIPLLLKSGLIALQNGLLPYAVTFRKYTFFSHVVAFVFFIFIGQQVFPRRPLKVHVFRFRCFHNLFT